MEPDTKRPRLDVVVVDDEPQPVDDAANESLTFAETAPTTTTTTTTTNDDAANAALTTTTTTPIAAMLASIDPDIAAPFLTPTTTTATTNASTTSSGYDETDDETSSVQATAASFNNKMLAAVFNSYMMPKTKRKIQTFTMNLYQFCVTIHSLFRDTCVKESPDARPEIVIPSDIKGYVSRTLSSAATMRPLSSGVGVGAKSLEFRERHKARILVHIVSKCFHTLESVNVNVAFSREALKFFLATHKNSVTPSDFADTNFNTRNEKKGGKNLNQLPLGGILQEYAKGLDCFIANIGRAAKEDVDALRFIIQNDLCLPAQIYTKFMSARFEDACYEYEATNVDRKDHVRIVCSNFKRAAILVTKHVILQFDGREFVVPGANVERDVPTSQMIGGELRDDDYVILDVMLCAKNRVIDLLAMRLNGDTRISDDYSERLNFVTSRFPELKCVVVSYGAGAATTPTNASAAVAAIAAATNDSAQQQQQQQQQASSNNFIQKPIFGRPSDVAYVYTKPPLTVAIVGRYEKHACLAFRQDERTLVVKLRSNVNGPLVPMILLRAFQPSTTTYPGKNPEIRVGDRSYEVVGDLFGVKLFREAVLAELRDNNKIGSLQSEPGTEVSCVNEYRPPVAPKNDAAIVHIENFLNKDIVRLADIIAKQSNGLKLLDLLREKLMTDIPVDFGSSDVTTATTSSSSSSSSVVP